MSETSNDSLICFPTNPKSTGVPKLAYNKFEAADALGVSVRTIDNLMAQKELKVTHIGRRVVIPVTSLTALLKRDSYTMAEAA